MPIFLYSPTQFRLENMYECNIKTTSFLIFINTFALGLLKTFVFVNNKYQYGQLR